MFNTDATALIARMFDADAMTESDLLALRRAFAGDLELSSDEADTLFRLNTLSSLPEAWQPYFTSVIASYVVDAMPPRDHLHEANAAWLMARIDHDGVVETDTELAIVLKVLRQAHSVCERFSAYALTQVKEAVLNGRGAFKGHVLTPGVVGEAELQLLRAVIYAGGGRDGIAVSRAEAELLMDINDATDGKANADGWSFLFSRAVANHLMMVRPTAITSEAALKRQEWLESRERAITPRKLFGWDFMGAIGDLLSINDDAMESHRSYVLDAPSTLNAERVTATEATWLVERLNRDGTINANERALLDFLRDESPEVHDSLRPLIRAA